MIWKAGQLSVLVSCWTVVITVPLSLFIATYLYESKWRWLEIIFLLPLFVPPTVTGFFLLWLLSPKYPFGRFLDSLDCLPVFSQTGTVLACVVVSFPLAFQFCMVGLSRVRKELVESGSVLGGTDFFNTLRLVWPQLKSSLLGASLLVFARAMGEFGASIMVGGNIPGETQTLPLAVYSFAESGDFAHAAQAALACVGVAVSVYACLRLLERKRDARGL